MNRNRRRAVQGLGLAGLLPQAFAQRQWPTQAIRIVVPFTPGGSTDILARAIGQELTKAWGHSVIVDNVPGAGGAIGADKVAKAPGDGYTLLMGHIGTLAVNPSLYPKLPYNPVKDFAAILRPLVGPRLPEVIAAYHRFERALEAEVVVARGEVALFICCGGGHCRFPFLSAFCWTCAR